MSGFYYDDEGRRVRRRRLPTGKRLEALESRVRELEERSAALERRLSSLEAAARAPKPAETQRKACPRCGHIPMLFCGQLTCRCTQ